MKNEEIKIVYNDEKMSIEHIKSYGVSSSNDFWYDQNKDEICYVIKGYGIIKFEDHEVKLCEGQSICIKKHVKHNVKETSFDCEWICVFTV